MMLPKGHRLYPCQRPDGTIDEDCAEKARAKWKTDRQPVPSRRNPLVRTVDPVARNRTRKLHHIPAGFTADDWDRDVGTGLKQSCGCSAPRRAMAFPPAEPIVFNPMLSRRRRHYHHRQTL